MRLFRILSLLALLSPCAWAQISITNWEMTDTSLSFDLSGSTTVASTPTLNTGRIFIGVPGVSTWINTADSGTATGEIDGKTSFLTFAQDYENGDYIEILTTVGEYDFTNGGSLSVTVSFTDQDFTTANLAEDSLKVFWGANSNGPPFPDPSTQIGSISAVPEPSTYAGITAVVVLGATLVRRRRSAA